METLSRRNSTIKIMKKLLFLFLLFENIIFSQEEVSNEYVVSTPDRKKIYVLNNETGRLIYESWSMDPIYNGFKPEVILVNNLEPYRKKYIKNKNKKS